KAERPLPLRQQRRGDVLRAAAIAAHLAPDAEAGSPPPDGRDVHRRGSPPAPRDERRKEIGDVPRPAGHWRIRRRAAAQVVQSIFVFWPYLLSAAVVGLWSALLWRRIDRRATFLIVA